ncbi:hypothetical protein [uncultured Thiohalocapsa sp.]|uniref:hypothetical protein n=1 Tax=uncultured Thiohalocapsa sp. TaxID=768990 RepID=UPI0025FBD975|nr:hypothetical protein [uncultured Thiohalocapsa sp.]
MTASELRSRLRDEIHDLPDSRLQAVYDLVHFFRLGLEREHAQMIKLANLKQRLLADADTRAANDALEAEHAIARELIAARARAGLSQAELAERPGTSESTGACPVPAGRASCVKVTELNDLFARIPKLGDDAGAFERDIADGHAAIVPDRDSWED